MALPFIKGSLPQPTYLSVWPEGKIFDKTNFLQQKSWKDDHSSVVLLFNMSADAEQVRLEDRNIKRLQCGNLY